MNVHSIRRSFASDRFLLLSEVLFLLEKEAFIDPDGSLHRLGHVSDYGIGLFVPLAERRYFRKARRDSRIDRQTRSV